MRILRLSLAAVIIGVGLTSCGGGGGGGSAPVTPGPALHQVTLRYPSGALQAQGMADASDRRQGAWSRWFESGQTQWQGSYVDGAIADPWREWNTDGSVRDDSADALQ